MGKIRTGFVSNSSAASFIIKTKVSEKRLLTSLLEEGWFSHFREEDVFNELDALLFGYESDQDDYSKHHAERLKIIKENLKAALARDKLDFVKEVLLTKQLVIKKAKGKAEIHGWSTCWNGVEDLGDLGLFILAVLVQLGVNPKLEVIDEQ